MLQHENDCCDNVVKYLVMLSGSRCLLYALEIWLQIVKSVCVHLGPLIFVVVICKYHLEEHLYRFPTKCNRGNEADDDRL